MKHANGSADQLAATSGTRQGNRPEKQGSPQKDGRFPQKDGRFPLPMGPSFVVRRTDLIREMVRIALRSGIVVICAPSGFGKTALLLQYADEVRLDPGRGTAYLINARHALVAELVVQIEAFETACQHAVRPVLCIDDLPAYEGADADRLIETLRVLRERDVEVVIACDPSARAFVSMLGDSAKLPAQKLLVHPREYAEWARVLSISSRLDVYGMTQGIPALVAALQAVTDECHHDRQLENGVYSIYWAMLDAVEHTDQSLASLAGLLLLVGAGSMADLKRAHVPVTADTTRRLMHDYPIFGYDAATGAFACLGSPDGALKRIRSYLAQRSPELVEHAVCVQLLSGRTDCAVELLEAYATPSAALEALEKSPLQYALAGQAPFISRMVGALEEEAGAPAAHPNIELAVYASSLLSGDVRMARSIASKFALHAEDVRGAVDPAEWALARALGAVWGTCRGVELPDIWDGARGRAASSAVRALELHARSFYGLIERGAWTGEVERFLERHGHALEAGNAVEVPRLLLQCDVMLAEALTGTLESLDQRDSELSLLGRTLRERRLMPLLCLTRFVCSTRRLLTGAPIVDEQGVVDANTMAVRTSDLSLQLLSSIFEGWQDLVANQAGSARFRGQQAIKLVGKGQPFLAGAATFLERIAHLRNSSNYAIREEAALLDLMQDAVGVEEAWAHALCLSAAHADAELSAWYSLHKETLLVPSFRLFARLAMSIMGDQADSMRRLLPRQLLPCYLMNSEEAPVAKPLFSLVDPVREDEAGHVTFRLLGGFSVERNGHLLTSGMWKRKKAGILAARLVLANGNMVNRQVIWEEFWPGLDYARARENLYSTVSVLRRAIGQQGKKGPQYVVLQGDSIGINTEYVTSDVQSFEDIVRAVLLGHLHLAAPKVIELCLKAEQLYAGPLFVPDAIATQFFRRMRRVLQSKYVDCMVRGITVAMEEEDLDSALWMAEAGLQRGANREDLLRAAMRVYDALGRRKDVVELYNAHLCELEMSSKGEPEGETTRLYHEILSRYRARDML